MARGQLEIHRILRDFKLACQGGSARSIRHSFLGGETKYGDLAPERAQTIGQLMLAVTVSLDHAVRAAEIERLFREQGGVDTAKDHPGTAFARFRADLVSAKHVGRVDADADDVALLNLFEVQLVERFVDENGIAELGRRCRRQHIEPPWRDNSGAKRHIARIDQKYGHIGLIEYPRAE